MRRARVLYVPYQLYRVGEELVACDSHFWNHVSEDILKTLLVRGMGSLEEAPSRDGIALKPLTPIGGHRAWLEWVQRLKVHPLPVQPEDLAAYALGLHWGGRLDVVRETLKGLARVLVGEGPVKPLGRYAWLRLPSRDCSVADARYRMLVSLDPGVGLRIKEEVCTATGYGYGYEGEGD
ncbi:MAG: hypothetical protein F7C08_03290 [Desulfurococcales archaeon]|nr:hypothetical protein [Desulfurococcales archaeon]MCE4605537.1 hypothetical protein [Desulfurococcales archaeon]